MLVRLSSCLSSCFFHRPARNHLCATSVARSRPNVFNHFHLCLSPRIQIIDKVRRDVREEVEILLRLHSHPNIVTLRDVSKHVLLSEHTCFVEKETTLSFKLSVTKC